MAPRSRRLGALQRNLITVIWVQLLLSSIAFYFLAQHDHQSPLESSEKMLSSTKHPLAGLIRTYSREPPSNRKHRRRCFAFTATPGEIWFLLRRVEQILAEERFAFVSCLHLSIPERAIRFQDKPYATTEGLMNHTILEDPRVIVHRLFDYGPMTRYLGPLAYENHPLTSIVIFDMDSIHLHDLPLLFYAAEVLDPSAMWCLQGENFRVNADNVVEPEWNTYKTMEQGDYQWNQVHFCRGVGGLLFHPRHFIDFWYNQSDYDESCFWDDDRWVGFQIERQGITSKVIHPHKDLLDVAILSDPSAMSKAAAGLAAEAEVPADPRLGTLARRRLGSLTAVNRELQSDQYCALAWLSRHPETFPSARTPGVDVRPPSPRAVDATKRQELQDILKSKMNEMMANSLASSMNETKQLRGALVILPASKTNETRKYE